MQVSALVFLCACVLDRLADVLFVGWSNVYGNAPDVLKVLTLRLFKITSGPVPGIKTEFTLSFRTSCLGTCCENSKTVTAGRSSGWFLPTSVYSSTKLTRWTHTHTHTCVSTVNVYWVNIACGSGMFIKRFERASLSGRVSIGQSAFAGLLCNCSCRVGEHSQGLRVQAALQIPHLLLQIRERVLFWKVHSLFSDSS